MLLGPRGAQLDFQGGAMEVEGQTYFFLTFGSSSFFLWVCVCVCGVCVCHKIVKRVIFLPQRVKFFVLIFSTKKKSMIPTGNRMVRPLSFVYHFISKHIISRATKTFLWIVHNKPLNFNKTFMHCISVSICV